MGHGRLGTLGCAMALALGVGCGESRTIDETDAAIVIDLDGAMIDGGTDAGPPSNVGAACAAPTDCTGLADRCISDPGAFPGGYCTRMCNSDEDCPTGSTCADLFGQPFCVDSCDPAGTECRDGYGCTFDDPRLPAPFCLGGGCQRDADCAGDLRCDPNGGQIGEGNCYDPSSSYGDPCEDESSCPMGGYCLAESFGGWPSGSCLGFGCNPTANTGCGDDAECLPSAGGEGGLCVDACDTDDDCRLGYTCRGTATYPDRHTCQPACTVAEDGSSPACTAGRVCNAVLGTCADPFPAGQLGAMCSRFSGGCTGGTCFSEGQTGYPGAYCAYEGCVLGDDTTCVDGGVCVAATGGGPNVCHKRCEVNTDCRAGYTCADADGEGEGTAGACLPQCTETAQCANASRGYVCDVASGRCVRGG